MSFKKVLLIKPSGRHGLSHIIDVIPTGLEYIAAMVEDVVEEVVILDLEMEHRPFDEVVGSVMTDLEPDLVGISMSATEHSEGLEIARSAKKRGAMTVLGGYHPTAIPHELLLNDQVDVVVRGEGEITMRELIGRGGPAGVYGLSYRDRTEVIDNPDRELVEDLDSLPFPARHLRRYTYRTTSMRDREHDVLTTSRGCPGRCTFCCEPGMNRSHQRYRSPENVMEEISEIVAYHDQKPLSIEVTDPNFMGSPERVGRLCDLLAEHNFDIRFGIKARADSVARYPDIVRKMIGVGIEGFEMGIESPNMKDLRSVSKGIRTDVHVRAVDNIKRWGGNAGGTFVIGLPDQTADEILQFPAYAKRIGLTSAAFGIATPFPGTPFYEELDAKELIFDDDWNRYDEMHSVFRTEHLSKDRIEELASICMAKFWTVDTFIEKGRMHLIRHAEKQSLAKFIEEMMHDLGFSLTAGSQLYSDKLNALAQEVVQASIDPGVEDYTREVGVHNVLEMSSFLRILGEQTLQITVRNNGEAITSWVINTTQDEVRNIQVMAGRSPRSSINIIVDLEDFRIGNGGPLTALDSVRILTKVLASNQGVKRRSNMMRLMMASGFELIRHQVGKPPKGNRVRYALKADPLGIES